MKHTKWVLVALAVLALSACGKSNDSEYTNTAPADNSTVAGVPNVPPAAVGTNLPQTIAGSSDDVFKAQSAQKTAEISKVKAARNMVPSTKAVVSPAPIDAINDQLATLGSLSVTSVNAQGYPVFVMECNKDAQCVNGVGIPMGNLADIAAQMTTVKQTDIQAYKYHCTTICVDNQNHIIGRPEVTTAAK